MILFNLFNWTSWLFPIHLFQTNVAAAMVGAGASLVGSVVSADAQSDAAESASAAQTQASREQIAEAKRQFDESQKQYQEQYREIRTLLNPYIDVGPGSLWRQQALLGQYGDEYQKQQVDWVANNPNTQALMQQGENAMLQNASATGGLRGGNIQGALAQFRPQLLNQELDKYYNRLGGMVSLGQNSVTGAASNAASTTSGIVSAGQNSSNQIINALGQQGAAQAGNYLAQGQAGASLGNGIASAGGLLGSYFSAPSSFGFGGSPVATSSYGFGGSPVATSSYGFGGTSTFGQPTMGYY